MLFDVIGVIPLLRQCLRAWADSCYIRVFSLKPGACVGATILGFDSSRFFVFLFLLSRFFFFAFLKRRSGFFCHVYYSLFRLTNN